MSRQFRFTIRKAIAATTLAVLWCAIASSHEFLWRRGGGQLLMDVYYGIVVGFPPAAICGLAGRIGLGVLCGLSSLLAFLTLQYLVSLWA
jgi:hypothetical protein